MSINPPPISTPSPIPSSLRPANGRHTNNTMLNTTINPQAPTHLLIIPKKPIPKLSDASAEDKELLGHLMWVAGEVARDLGLEETFRLVTNNGAGAGQSVFHLHLHLLSGRPLQWPPG